MLLKIKKIEKKKKNFSKQPHLPPARSIPPPSIPAPPPPRELLPQREVCVSKPTLRRRTGGEPRVF